MSRYQKKQKGPKGLNGPVPKPWWNKPKNAAARLVQTPVPFAGIALPRYEWNPTLVPSVYQIWDELCPLPSALGRGGMYACSGLGEPISLRLRVERIDEKNVLIVKTTLSYSLMQNFVAHLETDHCLPPGTLLLRKKLDFGPIGTFRPPV
jgi:hypothetical protein